MTRTERTYYLVFGGYSVAQFSIAPIYPLFLLSRGCDLFQMNVVLTTYLITVLVFEVPTGAVADVFGRKASFLLACAVRMWAYGLYAFAEDFGDCLVAELFDAVGTTLASGALEAWVVDGVRAEGDRRPTDALFARAQVIARAAMVGGAIVAGLVASTWGWAAPWLACSALFAVTAATGALLMREPPRARAAAGTGGLARTVLTGVGAVRRSPMLLVLSVLTLVGAFAAFPFHMFWQPRMEALLGSAPLLWIGVLQACLNVMAIAGSALLPRLLQRFERHVVLCAATLWRALLVAFAAVATTIAPVTGGLLLQEIAAGLSDPVLTAWTNEHVAPAERATVLSVRSVFFTFGGAAGLLSVGLLANTYGIPLAWVVSAALFALTAPAYLLLPRAARRTLPVGLEPLPPVPTKISPIG